MNTLNLRTINFFILLFALALMGTPAANALGELTFIQANTHQLDYAYDSSAKEWTLTTTGTDPYFYTDRLTSNLPASYCIFSFEYNTAQGIDDLQLFFGDPVSEARSVHLGAVQASTEWKEYTIDVGTQRTAYNWGRSNNRLRIDLGYQSGVTIQLRNLKLRERTPAEQHVADSTAAAEKYKQNMALHLTQYLSKAYPSSITNVEVTKSQVTITGTTGNDGPYALVECTPYEELTETKRFRYRTPIDGTGNFTITLDRSTTGRYGYNYDRLLSKWAVARVVSNDSDALDSHARYADAVEPIRTPAPIPLKNKKGVGAGDTDRYIQDFDDLGLGSITLNATLSSFVGTSGIPHRYGGTTYYMQQKQVEYVDRIVSGAQKRGIVVSAIILTPTNSVFKDPEATGGNFSMPNMTTASAVMQYAAVIDFMASRWSTAEHGRIAHWIMHNEVDMANDWTNMGTQPVMRYIDRYQKSLRLVYNIVRQYDQNAAVLGSYTHSWTLGLQDKDYNTKNMIEQMVNYSNAEGDYWWGLAMHPYPEDLSEPEFWKKDIHSTYDMDNTSYVTFKNLEVYDKWIKLQKHLYKGTTKRILFLSENGTNSRDYSDTQLTLQAAGGCWAWKKAQKLDGIDAIQWHNWHDNRAEGGLRIGLRAFGDPAYGFKWDQAKPVWYVWQAAGTENEDQVFQPYLKVIGINSWDEIFHEATGVDGVEASPASLKAWGGTGVINNDSASPAQVYNLAGQPVGHIGADATLSVPAGIYIVRNATGTIKVAVK